MSEKEDYRKQFDEVLKSIAPTKSATKERLGFLDRLLSFQTPTYSAKPIGLSPYVCARFGWKNVDRDMLACSCCSAVLAIVVPPNLSLEATNLLCEKYRRNLATAHDDKCTFRMMAEKYLCSESDSPANKPPVVPPAFSPLLPSPCLMELEHQKPGTLMRKRVDKILQQLSRKLPKVASYQSFPGASKDDQLPSRFENAGRALKTTEDFAVQLAVLFWTLVDEPKESQRANTVILGCPLCWASFDVTVSSEGDRAGQPRKRVRREEKVYNLFNSHRYYCPVRCGFPCLPSTSTSQEPLWEVALQRLDDEFKGSQSSLGPDENSNELDSADVVNSIRKAFLAGIAKRKDLIVVDDDEEAKV